MYKLYITCYNIKSNVKGFWQNKGKVYIDNINIVKYKNKSALDKNCNKLYSKGEKAVFYTVNDRIAIIKNRNGEKEILNKKLRIKVYKINKKVIKKYLLLYGGLTIFRKKDRYIIEIWHNKNNICKICGDIIPLKFAIYNKYPEICNRCINKDVSKECKKRTLEKYKGY